MSQVFAAALREAVERVRSARVTSIFSACAGGTERRRADAADALLARGHRARASPRRVRVAPSRSTTKLQRRCPGCARIAATSAVPGLDRACRRRARCGRRREPGALGGAAGDDLADHRRAAAAGKAQARRARGRRSRPRRPESRAGRASPSARWPRSVCTSSAQRLALQRRLQHAPAQLLPGGDRLAVDRAHRVAGVQPGRGGDAARAAARRAPAAPRARRT